MITRTDTLEVGRYLRDRAKDRFSEDISEWRTLASQAVVTHTAAAITHPESPPHTRELAASIAMRARLEMRHELAGGSLPQDTNALEGFRLALGRLRVPGQQPDQYEINFIAAGALKEATDQDGSRLTAARLVGRSAWLAACSESPYFARETNPDLTTAERFKAKGRAFGRTAIAAVGTVIGPRAAHIKPFAKLASKVM